MPHPSPTKMGKAESCRTRGLYLEIETDKTESLQSFIQKVKRITELKTLTPELTHEFVDRIVMYAPMCINSKQV